MSKEIRVAAGIPTGGQYAPHNRTDSDIALVADGHEAEVSARRAAFDAVVIETQQAYAATKPARAAFDNSVELSPDYYVQLANLKTSVKNWQRSLKRQERLGALVTVDNEPQPASNLDEAVQQTLQAHAAVRSARISFANAPEGTDLYRQRLGLHQDSAAALKRAIRVEKRFGGTGDSHAASSSGGDWGMR